MIGIYIPIMECQREALPLFFNYFPLSFEGEGDKVGSLKNQRFFRVHKGVDRVASGEVR